MGGVTRLDLEFLNSCSSSSRGSDFNFPRKVTNNGSIILEINDKHRTKPKVSCCNWNSRLCLVFLPFVLFGFPIHLIFDFCHSADKLESDPKCKRKNTSVNWFRSVTSTRTNFRSLVLTTGTGIITTLWTLYAISKVYIIFYELIVLGHLSSQVSTAIVRTFYLTPFIVPTVLTWMHGHRVKQLVEMFDEVKPHLLKLAYINNNEVNPQHLRPANALAYVNCKLIVFYALIYALVVLQILADYSIVQEMAVDYESLIHYGVIALYLLTLPVYGLLCWGLLSEIQLISVYLRSLRIYGIRPSSAIFEQIKLCYKSISKHILIVNRTCKLFMCWAVPIILVFAISNMINGITYLAEPLYGWTSEFLGYHTVGPGFPTMITNDWNRTAALLDFPTENVIRDVAPQLVRGSAGYLIVGTLKIMLTWYSYWQAVKVNDQYRQLHVLLNDFVTNSNVAAASTELYQAFQLLKLYVHSTMEYHSPSLLRIPILSCFPYFGKRLHRA